MAMRKPSLASIKDRILKARRILLAGHSGPDFDSAGALMALYLLLKSKNKRVVIALKANDSIWGYLPFFKKGGQAKLSFRPDLAILVDYGRKECVEPLALEIIDKARPFVISIDHHPFQGQIGDMIWLDSKKSSVSEMVLDLFKGKKRAWSQDAIYSVLLGILGDTGGFAHYPFHKKMAFKIAAIAGKGEAFRRAARATRIWKESRELLLYAKYLAKTAIEPELGFAHITIRKVIYARNNLNSRLADQLIFVEGIKVALVLKRLAHGGYKGSLRGSYRNTLDLGLVASCFGGGGHFNSAGFKSDLSSVKIIAKVRQLIVGGQAAVPAFVAKATSAE